MSKTQCSCRMSVSRLSQQLIISATKCHGSIQGAPHAVQKCLKDGLMDTADKQIQIPALTTGKKKTNQITITYTY